MSVCSANRKKRLQGFLSILGKAFPSSVAIRSHNLVCVCPQRAWHSAYCGLLTVRDNPFEPMQLCQGAAAGTRPRHNSKLFFSSYIALSRRAREGFDACSRPVTSQDIERHYN